MATDTRVSVAQIKDWQKAVALFTLRLARNADPKAQPFLGVPITCPSPRCSHAQMSASYRPWTCVQVEFSRYAR